jgi:hypothetical protein
MLRRAAFSRSADTEKGVTQSRAALQTPSSTRRKLLALLFPALRQRPDAVAQQLLEAAQPLRHRRRFEQRLFLLYRQV